jgi:hypothetical protein
MNVDEREHFLLAIVGFISTWPALWGVSSVLMINFRRSGQNPLLILFAGTPVGTLAFACAYALGYVLAHDPENRCLSSM